jgi:hypothetical protein
MIILEYKLDATPAGMMCPPWIDDGGYWGGINNTYIGVTRDNPEFHIPSTVNRLTPLELETRQLAIHSVVPMIHHDTNEVLSEEEVITTIQNWCSTWL